MDGDFGVDAGGMNGLGCEALVRFAIDVTEDAMATTYTQVCDLLARVSRQGVDIASGVCVGRGDLDVGHDEQKNIFDYSSV